MSDSGKQPCFTGNFGNGLKDWTLKGTACLGRWYLENEELVYDILPPNEMGRGFISTRCQFNRVQKVSMEFYLPDVPSCDVDVWLRSYGYTSVARITRFSSENGYAVIQRMNYVKRTEMQPIVRNELPADSLQCGCWNRFTLTITGQSFTLSLNDSVVAQCTDPDYTQTAPVHLHLKTSGNGARFRNLAVWADGMLPEKQEVPENTVPTCYTAQITTDRLRPFGFLEPAGSDCWHNTNREGIPVYGTAAHNHFCHTWLHGFEKGGTVSATVLCDTPGHRGQGGIFARFSVDGSYLRAGYDFGRQAWFIAASLGKVYRKQFFSSDALSPMIPGRFYDLRLEYQGEIAKLLVDGVVAVQADGLGNLSFGRIGLFAENAGLYASAFSCYMPSGSRITDGVLEQTIAPDRINFHFEIERLDRNTLFGVFCSRRFLSLDAGVHFSDVTDLYPDVNYGGSYPSIHRRKSDGMFIQLVCEKDFLIQESKDLKNWTDLCHLLPRDRIYDEQGRFVALVHVSSITELPMPDGSTRIFLPVAFRNYINDVIAGHYTCVFYSDDGGHSWQESEKNVRDLPNFPSWHGNMSWCESKIIRCADGRLRMLCSRTIAPCIYYADSFDNGRTWSSYGELPALRTPTTSFAICEDPSHPGSYLMVYVKGEPYFASTIFPRTRLVLVRTDGLVFEELMDVERFSTAFAPLEGTAELYQILDPCINVFPDYIFISFGRSDDVGGVESPHHNGQRIRFVRIDRSAAGI